MNRTEYGEARGGGEASWVVFDLGGVLVNYVGVARLRQWMGADLTDHDMHRRWLYSPAVRAFESGQSSAEDFAHAVIREFALDTHAEEFLGEFPDFVEGLYPGAEDLLTAVGERFPLALLSNTNRPQWEKLIRTTNLRPHFRRVFLSFEMGLMKPERAVFEHVAKELATAPGGIIFFDDNPANIEAARKFGIDGRLVEDFADLRRQVNVMLGRP